MEDIKLPKNQKCWLCKKLIKKDFAFNGHYWHIKCKDKDTEKIVKEYKKTL